MRAHNEVFLAAIKKGLTAISFSCKTFLIIKFEYFVFYRYFLEVHKYTMVDYNKYY